MSKPPYTVVIVLDPNCGPELETLLSIGPVWAMDSGSNRQAAVRVWKEQPHRTHLDGITLFDSARAASPEQALIYELDTIDLHHGVYSADPPVTILQVVGASLSAEVERELSTYGYDIFHPVANGFQAVRPLPPPLD